MFVLLFLNILNNVDYGLKNQDKTTIIDGIYQNNVNKNDVFIYENLLLEIGKTITRQQHRLINDTIILLKLKAPHK